eukprot:4560138-Amphidinium_carterae.1
MVCGAYYKEALRTHEQELDTIAHGLDEEVRLATMLSLVPELVRRHVYLNEGYEANFTDYASARKLVIEYIEQQTWFGANCSTTLTWRVSTTTFRSATGHLLDSCRKRRVQLRDNRGQRVDATFHVVNDENTPVIIAVSCPVSDMTRGICKMEADEHGGSFRHKTSQQELYFKMNSGIYKMSAWIDDDGGKETDVTEHVCGLEVTLEPASADGP